MEFFAQIGCCVSDHALEYVMYAPAAEEKVNEIFKKRLNGESISREEEMIFKTAFMQFVGKAYHKKNWVMQIHYGCKRDNNAFMYEQLGPDTGYDCINNYAPSAQTADFLNSLIATNELPKTILYSLNPNDNEAIGTILGCFQGTEEQQVPEQKLTKEEYAAKKQQEREEVWAEVDSQAQGVFQDGEKLKGFLDFMAECNTQRTPNLLLIYGQHPDFKVVRSYERWREEHRSVKAGEHGITYMISTEYEKDGEMRRGYTIGKGFDISQMSGKPLEERPQRSLTELIGTVLKDQSVRVQIEDDLPDKVQAQYNPRYRTIYIRNGMSEVTTFHALNRELACAALDQHTGTYSRQKVSAQAYCAAYVIAKRYGVDVTGFNLEYIAQRNECGKKDPQELRDFLNDVRQASYSIRNHIERNFGAKEQEYITDEFAIGDPVKIPETKDEKPSEKASGKEKKAKSQPER